MYLGDNILREGIVEHAKKFKENKSDANIMLTEVKNPEQFGVADINEDGTIKRLVEKPDVPPSNFALVGIYFFKPVILEACKSIKPSWRNELEITDAIQWLIDNGYYTSIGNKCAIEDTEIEDSIVMDRSEITGGGRILESLIGKEVKIRRKVDLPNGRKLIVGDQSEIVG